jgi:hypothetical protein
MAIVPQHIPAAYRQASDAARRCADRVNTAAVAGCMRMWVAIQLADGRSDGNVYDTREAAIRHQLRPEYCTFVQVPPGGMQDHEAQALLDYWRAVSDAGVRDDDPGLLLPLMPLLARDRRRQIRALAKGRR